MKKLLLILAVTFSTASYAQHNISFEINSGIEEMQSNPSGLIEIGNQLVSIETTFGNNFNQSDLKVFNKNDGTLLFSEILSNSFDDYFSIIEAVEIDESSNYIFAINKSGFDSNTG